MDLNISIKLIERMRKRMRDKRFDAIVFFEGKAGRVTKSIAEMLKSSVINPPSGEAMRDWLDEGRRAAITIKKSRDGK